MGLSTSKSKSTRTKQNEPSCTQVKVYGKLKYVKLSLLTMRSEVEATKYKVTSAAFFHMRPCAQAAEFGFSSFASVKGITSAKKPLRAWTDV